MTPIPGGREAQRIERRDRKVISTAKRYRASGSTILVSKLARDCNTDADTVRLLLRNHDDEHGTSLVQSLTVTPYAGGRGGRPSAEGGPDDM